MISKPGSRWLQVGIGRESRLLCAVFCILYTAALPFLFVATISYLAVKRLSKPRSSSGFMA